MNTTGATPIVLIGAGGHARACIDVIEEQGVYVIAGLVGNATEVGSAILGYPVLGTDGHLRQLRYRFAHALVTVGQIRSPELRIRLAEALAASGWETPVIVSPRAHVSRHATIGEGTIVMHGAVVNAGARVGRHCILNSQSLVEHDVVVEDFCHLSTNAAINSGVHVGPGSFLGSGSTVRQGLILGARCLVPMGVAVRSNCPAGTLYHPRSGE